jgi:hypothetical protein
MRRRGVEAVARLCCAGRAQAPAGDGGSLSTVFDLGGLALAARCVGSSVSLRVGSTRLGSCSSAAVASSAVAWPGGAT